MSEQKASKKKNCAKCNKPVKKIKQYYRDGKFFCSKKCYKAMKAEQNKKEADKQ